MSLEILKLVAFSILFTSFLQAEKKPNIIFLFADDQTTNTIGCYGNEIIKTPHLDQLANEGTLFKNAFVSSPICMVSRGTILTGLTNRAYGSKKSRSMVAQEHLDSLYTDHLHSQGYRTAHFGKWHTVAPKAWRPEKHYTEFKEINRNPFFKRQADGTYRHETELIIDNGIDFIQRHPKDQPFALNLWFNACHAADDDRRPGIGQFPWPMSANGLYEGIPTPMPKLSDPKIFEQHPSFFKTSITRERYFWRWNTPQKYDTNIRAYYRMVTGIDTAIGRLLKTLDDQGIADNTIIVYSADNGYLMANRGLAGKWNHYEDAIRVPLIIKDPRPGKSLPGVICDAPALNLDFPATFLDWAGAPIPNKYQGRSLAPLLNGKTPSDWRTHTFHEHFISPNMLPPYEALRGARYKYARYFDHDHEFLHDLESDPNELINLATSPQHQDIIEELRAKLSTKAASLGDPLPPSRTKLNEVTTPHPEISANVSHVQDIDGYTSLFNGKNLAGWSGLDGLWRVKDGIIIGKHHGQIKRNRFLSWKGSTIRNFDLKVKVRISKDGNSGIQYRSHMLPKVGLDIVKGYQCDILPDGHQFNAMIYEERGRGILSERGQSTTINKDSQKKNKPLTINTKEQPGWNTYRILVNGNHHQTFLNGELVSELFDNDAQNASKEGILAFQLHTGPAMTIELKDIKIKQLRDENPTKENR